MKVTVIQEPVVEPVTLDEIKLFLRIDGDTHPDDEMLEGMITAARQECEELTSRAFVQQTLRVSLAGFSSNDPCCRFNRTGPVYLIRPPVIQVLTVNYYDSDGAAQVVDADQYYVTDDRIPEVRFFDSFSYPTTQVRSDAVFVEYVAGYEPVDSNDFVGNIPKPIIHAIKIDVQLMYDELAVDKREALTKQRDALLKPYKVYLV